jgi:hypothetical protein
VDIRKLKITGKHNCIRFLRLRIVEVASMCAESCEYIDSEIIDMLEVLSKGPRNCTGENSVSQNIR